MSDWEVVQEGGGSDWSVVEEGGPESFLHPDKFKPSPQHRPLANTGSMEQVRSGLAAERAKYQNSDARDLENALAVPNSMVNTATLGAYGGALKTARELEEAITGVDNPTSVAARSLSGMERYHRDAPTVSSLTDVPAYFTRGPMAVAEGVSKSIPAASTALGRIAHAGVTSGITSGLMGGTEAAFEGKDFVDTMRQAGESALAGNLLGVGTGAGATAIGKAAKSVIGSRGGQARQFLEGQGVEVGPTTPGRGPKIDTMANKGTTDAAIGQQAEVSAKRGLDMLKEEKGAVLGTLGRRYGRIAQTPEAQKLHDASDIVTNIQDALDDLDISPQAEQSLRSALEKVTKAQGKTFNPDVDPYLLSETELNKLKRRLDRAGKTGLSTDEATSPVRRAANQTREIVNEGPYAEANADYAKESKHYQQSRRLLGVNERPKTPEESKTAVNTVKNLITRRGQNTVTAGGQTDALTEFSGRHPDIGEELMRPEILRKRADLSFHLLPQKHGGLIDRTGSGIGGLALVESLMHALGSGHVDLSKAAAAGGLGLTMQNMPAIQGRLLYGPAQGALQLEPMFLEGVPLLQAAARNSMERR